MADLENRVSNLESRVTGIETKVDMFIQEMRDRDNRRDAEIAEIRQKQEADMKEIRSTFDKINDKFDKINDKFDRMNDKMDGMDKHFRNLTVAAMVGIGAMSMTVVGFFISLVFR